MSFWRSGQEQTFHSDIDETLIEDLSIELAFGLADAAIHPGLYPKFYAEARTIQERARPQILRTGKPDQPDYQGTVDLSLIAQDPRFEDG